MDLGLGRFMEMFEERFGRKPTTALIALIALGLASVSVGLIWSNLVSPVWQLIKVHSNANVLTTIQAAFAWGLPILVVFGLFYAFIVQKNQGRLLESISGKVDQAIERAKSEADKKQLAEAKVEFIDLLTSATVNQGTVSIGTYRPKEQ